MSVTRPFVLTAALLAGLSMPPTWAAAPRDSLKATPTLPDWAAEADTLRVPLAVACPPETLDLGAPFAVSLRVVVPGIEGLALATPQASLEPFEIAGWRREVDRGDTAVVTLTLRPFRVGPLTLPPLTLAGWTRERSLWLARGDSVRVHVASIVPEGATEIMDIHEAIPLAGPRPWWMLLAAGAAMLAALALFRWLRRRARFALEEAPPALPAHEIALSALDRLAGSGLLKQGPWKPFYTELTDILRRYLARRYGLDAPDLTTTETLHAASECEMPGAAYAALRTVLGVGDAVKFARHQPAPGHPDSHIADARRFVELTGAEPMRSAVGDDR